MKGTLSAECTSGWKGDGGPVRGGGPRCVGTSDSRRTLSDWAARLSRAGADQYTGIPRLGPDAWAMSPPPDPTKPPTTIARAANSAPAASHTRAILFIYF